MQRIAAVTITVAVAAIGLLSGPFGRAQAPTASPAALKFEVAMIKPSKAEGGGGGVRPAPGGERYVATNVPLKFIMMVAYRVKAEQIVGGPSWTETDRYDMNAKAEKPSSGEELRSMLQNLLADRFQLRFHRETKELPVYALSVDKSGPKMQAHEAQNAGEPWIDIAIERMLQVKMTAKFVTMDYFAFRLNQMLDRPVLDLTKIKGGHDFELKYTRQPPPNVPDGATLNGVQIDTSGPTIFEALKQQLGLKLEPQKGPVEMIVIDHAEKPVEN